MMSPLLGHYALVETGTRYNAEHTQSQTESPLSSIPMGSARVEWALDSHERAVAASGSAVTYRSAIPSVRVSEHSELPPDNPDRSPGLHRAASGHVA